MVLENRVRLSESQVIKKEDLYIRWEHATKQEIAELCGEGKLHSYQHHKGPINGVLFCVPAYAWHDARWYHDEDVTYFLLEDVERCEKEYPDFVGNVLPAPAPLPTVEYIPIKQIQKALGMSPQVFVDFLNDDSSDRLLTSWEEGFRNAVEQGGWRGAKRVPYFKVADLDSEYLHVHHVDWENFQQSNTVNSTGANIWSYVTRRDELQSDKKDARIAELEKAVAAAHEEMRNIGEQAKTSIHNVAAAGDEVVEDLQAELAEKESHIAELEKQLADMQKNTEALPVPEPMLQEKDALISGLQSEIGAFRKLISGYGALSLMVGMLEAGSTKEDIAKHLKEKGGLSYSQVGVLLHENPLNVGDSAITMCAKRLLGIA